MACTPEEKENAILAYAQGMYGQQSSYNMDTVHNVLTGTLNYRDATKIAVPNDQQASLLARPIPGYSRIVAEFANPKDIVPKAIYNEVDAAVQESKRTSENPQKKIKEIRDSYDLAVIESPMAREYINQWFESLIKERETRNNTLSFTGKIIDNAVGNLFRLNPKVSALQFVDLARIPVKYPGETISGTLDAIKATEGQLWKTIPELDRLGIYGHDHGFSIVKLADNVTKNLAYHTALRAEGDPIKASSAMKSIVLEYDIHNRPMAMWGSDSYTKYLFMRYGIEEQKYLVGNALALASKDPKVRAVAARATALNFIIRPYLFGVATAIPKSIAALFTDEEGKDLDEILNTNQLKKYTGYDFSQTLSPSAITLGAGYEIFNTGVKASYADGTKALAAWKAGDADTAFENALKFGYHSSIFVPYLGDNLLRKAFKQYLDIRSGKLNPEDIPSTIPEKYFGVTINGDSG